MIAMANQHVRGTPFFRNTNRAAAVHRAGAAKSAFAEQLWRILEETVAAVAATAELRDPYTAGHQRRVATLVRAIAREMGLSANRVRAAYFAALVHDIGKVKVPTELLTKPTPLTPLELQMMRTHVEAGYEILKGVEFPCPIAEIVLQHHERLDGSGYPNGLKGDAIHL
jgi:putative nucleotidyltransferase with HDIG domain